MDSYLNICENDKDLSFMWSIFIAFIISFILSYFSLGFFFFLFIFIVLEIFYAFMYNFNYTSYILSQRTAIFFAAIFGFVLGRLILCGDHNPFRHSFHEWI